MKSTNRYSGLLQHFPIKTAAFVLTLVYLVVSLLFIRSGSGIVFLLPVFLLTVLLAIVSLEKLLLLTLFLTPLSVQLRFIRPETPFDLFLPTEIFLAGILIIMVFKVFFSREAGRDLLTHPVSVIAFLLLGWSLFTSLSGTMVSVSIKSFVTRLWFFASFYMLAVMIFRKTGVIRQYFLSYIAGLVPVVIFFLARMNQSGLFNQAAAYSSTRPFFNDHTALGASLAFCIPVVIYLIFSSETRRYMKLILCLVLTLFILAFAVSYSRAAWVSLAISVLFALALMLRIGWRVLVPGTAIIIIIIISWWQPIIMGLKENRQESSTRFATHIQSIANIQTDASNMERINRWNAALRMFREKPLLGWGPGTYQFQYAPFQMASEKTIISTNMGERGNAHSEYLGALCESGIGGLIFYSLLLVVIIWRGINLRKRITDKDLRALLLALLAGLVTYVVHGALNNFLDTDKISALFWGMAAAIVAIEISAKENSVRPVSKDLPQ